MISPYRIPAKLQEKKESRHWKCILFGHKMILLSWLRIVFTSRYVESHPALGLKLRCIRCNATFDDTKDALDFETCNGEKEYIVLSPGKLIPRWRFPDGLPKRVNYDW